MRVRLEDTHASCYCSEDGRACQDPSGTYWRQERQRASDPLRQTSIRPPQISPLTVPAAPPQRVPHTTTEGIIMNVFPWRTWPSLAIFAALVLVMMVSEANADLPDAKCDGARCPGPAPTGYPTYSPASQEEASKLYTSGPLSVVVVFVSNESWCSVVYGGVGVALIGTRRNMLSC